VPFLADRQDEQESLFLCTFKTLSFVCTFQSNAFQIYLRTIETFRSPRFKSSSTCNSDNIDVKYILVHTARSGCSRRPKQTGDAVLLLQAHSTGATSQAQLDLVSWAALSCVVASFIAVVVAAAEAAVEAALQNHRVLDLLHLAAHARLAQSSQLVVHSAAVH
jgi:hypothetical protein